MANSIFEQKPSMWQRIWFYLTCWRPITKYEFLSLQSQLVIILDGIREGDLQHYQAEKALELMIIRFQQNGNEKTETKKEQSNDEMFS